MAIVYIEYAFNKTGFDKIYHPALQNPGFSSLEMHQNHRRSGRQYLSSPVAWWVYGQMFYGINLYYIDISGIKRRDCYHAWINIV